MPGAGEDPKVQALRAERSLNLRPEAVVDEQFSSSEFLDARDLVQVKYEMVRRARVNGAPVSRAAEAFGFSRPAFYAAQAALDRPGPKGAHKMTADVVGFARERLDADPKLSSQALAELITERFGVKVHRRSVERALARAQRAERDTPDEESEDD
jgi:hypothetical protein